MLAIFSYRKKIEVALKESEEKYRSIYDNSHIAILLTAPDGRIVSANGSACRLFGYSEDEICKQGRAGLVDLTDPRLPLLLEERKTSGQSKGELLFKRKDGTYFEGEISSSVFKDKQGQELTSMVIRDLTRQKQAEEALIISEQKYRYLFEHNPQPMWIYDIETLKFLEVNNAAQHQYGYSRVEFLQMTLPDIRPKEDLELFFHDIKRTTDEFNRAGEWRHLTKDGKIIHVEITSHAINYEAKKARLVISTNITQRKLAEKRLKTLSLAVEQNPASIIITDSHGKIEFVNAKFTSFMHYTLGEVKGKTPRIFNPGHASKEEYDKMWQVLRSGKSWQGEYKNRKKDRSEFWENVLISPLIEENGVLSNYVLIMEDITEKKKMLDDLIAAKEKAEESDHLKTAFLQNMSHEIRTPLNAIMGFSDLLSDNVQKVEKTRKYAQIIKQRSNYLLEIINDILEFARIESGQLPLHISECNLNSVLSEFEAFIQELRTRTDKLNIAFKMNRPVLDKHIFIDETKLKQILINLTSNAFKFTHEGEVSVNCTLLGENCLQFSVSDTGIGIPQDKTKEIFERFKQANNDISKTYGGTGLGLSIVKGLLDLQGGEIWLTTEQGKGTTFYFTIPFRS